MHLISKLKDSDPETAAFLESSFTVNKTKIPFSAIGTDHAIEHENRAMKVMECIKRIASQPSKLDKHFLVLPEINRVLDEFHTVLAIKNTTKEYHYQLTGNTNSRIMQNAKKLLDVLSTHSCNFDKTDQQVFNIVTKAVLSEKSAEQFLQVEKEGEKLRESFIQDRLRGSSSIWSPLKKRKLPTFSENCASVKVKLKDKVATLREERRLLTRFLMAYRERPEVDLPTHLGEYEFSVVPRSMFNSDGRMLLATDKSSVMHEIEKMLEPEDAIIEPVLQGDRVVMFDGMGLVNKMKKTAAIKTCKDFADAFVQRILLESRTFQQINLIFDRYMTTSLKAKTRDKRTKGISTRYKIADDTNIENVSLKSLLSHVETKQELTAYLSRKVTVACRENQKRYVIVYENTCETNVPISPNLLSHEHEEADTLIILYGIEAARLNPFQELVVCSPDTDVLLLLIHYYEQLCTHTIFQTGRGNQVRNINVGKAHEALGKERSDALLGFHCFTGCDQTAKFYGKSKLTCWKTFMNCSPSVLSAFNSLGDFTNGVSPSTRAGLHMFLLDLYCKSRPQHVSDVSKLRWYLYSKKQVESEQLPPTAAALEFKIKRSHYMTFVWKNACEPAPQLPNPEDFGWKLKNDQFDAIMTNAPPVPNAIVELSFCKCKTACNTNRCKCHKNDLLCTEMCYCETCENCEDNDEVLSDVDDENSDDDV